MLHVRVDIDAPPRLLSPRLPAIRLEPIELARCQASARSVEIGEAISSSPRPEDQLSEINWAVELRKIEREYDGLPPEPTPTDLRQKRDAERRERERDDAASASFGAYFRLTLVICLGVSIACWPYDVSCGFMLSGYLAAVFVLVTAGIWTAMATFTHRMPRRHLIALGVVVWGLVLGAAQVLPRIGYANASSGRATVWHCVQ
jgi:hypothetical protein